MSAFRGIQTNLKSSDSCHVPGRVVPPEIFMALKFGMGFLVG